MQRPCSAAGSRPPSVYSAPRSGDVPQDRRPGRGGGPSQQPNYLAGEAHILKDPFQVRKARPGEEAALEPAAHLAGLSCDCLTLHSHLLTCITGVPDGEGLLYHLDVIWS